MIELKKMPVFPNWFPYNDMLLDEHMKVDKWEGVKTRSWEWNYRGPVLLYNSLRTAKPAVEAYNYANDHSKHKVIIGVGELVDVRLLTIEEALQMVCNFNNMSRDKVSEVLRKNGFSDYKASADEDVTDSPLFYFYAFGPYVAPLDTGFFFKNLRRFKKPVPFNWPSGPIKPIFTKITLGSKLHKQLKQSGF